MKKSNFKTSVLRVVQRAIGSEVEKNNSGNSFCIGILHQPKRPKRTMTIRYVAPDLP